MRLYVVEKCIYLHIPIYIRRPALIISGNQAACATRESQAASTISGNQAACAIIENQAPCITSGSQAAYTISGNQATCVIIGNQAACITSESQANYTTSENQAAHRIPHASAGMLRFLHALGAQSDQLVPVEEQVH